jgi:membrane associated rhomboid family serine protease
MFFIPGVVLFVIATLLAIHAGLQWLDEEGRDQVILLWGFIPGRLSLAIWPQWLAELVNRAAIDSDALAQARWLRDSGVLTHGVRIWTFATYAFLHGSWAHVVVNCIWLVAFGPPIARRCGPLRFLGFFVLTSIAGALAHWALSPFDFNPMIGASAADSGLMAAAARFIFQPGAPLGGPRGFSASLARPGAYGRAASLREVFTDRRALLFIGIWMATNIIFGAGARTLGASDAPVAWVAHIGGFVAGLIAFPLFDRGARPDELYAMD